LLIHLPECHALRKAAVGSRKWNRDIKGLQPMAPRRPRARPGVDYALPRLRVVLDSGGTLMTALPPRQHTPGGDEGWWQAVMNDWRTPRQTRHHFDRLGEHHGETIAVVCAVCRLHREFRTAELLAIYGPDYRMVYLGMRSRNALRVRPSPSVGRDTRTTVERCMQSS
jgi:hypothetical protein